MTRSIRLRGINSLVKDRVWETTGLLRIGRLETLEVVLDDNSVSRIHAEIKPSARGWMVKDLGSTNGTRLNGLRLGTAQWPLKAHDMLQFGELTVVVDSLVDSEPDTDPASPVPDMRVSGMINKTWQQAMEDMAYDSTHSMRPGDQLMALLRAGHHLVHIDKEEELLQSILNDAVTVLDAQRGAIVLAEPPNNTLQIKAIANGKADPKAIMAGRAEPGRFQFSKSLANRCFSRGESILCHRIEEDPELALARSIAEGSMASVLCVLLRTPRKQLGVLHLDRSPWHRPFTPEDLRLADALAANVSAGIECAQLLRKQRDLFLDTITILAQAVELRDECTGNHTYRVTQYSILLAKELELSEDQQYLLRIGTPLHDIGKIGIDDAILRKPDKLTDEEFAIMKTHTTKGAEIVSTIPDLLPIVPIVRSHHERWDGRGYPDGKAGDAIDPLARIVALADAFDAMTQDRPYRRGMPAQVAFAEIEKQKGKQFDPKYAEAFLRIQADILKEMKAQADQTHATRRTRVMAAYTG